MNYLTIHTDNYEVVKLCDKEFLLANVVGQTTKPDRKYEVILTDERSEVAMRKALHNIYQSVGLIDA